MAVDYRKQYRPDQLEPFWPNEAMKMGTAVLCTLAVIMIFAIMPVILDAIGLGEMLHAEEPADPYGTTPVGIKPEWYFLSTFEFLKYMPAHIGPLEGEEFGLALISLGFVVWCLVPWIDRGRSRRMTTAVMVAGGLILVFLSILTYVGHVA